jgi:hypothetical protein
MPEESESNRRQDLIAENRRLRKEIKRLRKENEHLRNRHQEVGEFLREEIDEPTNIMETLNCPMCGSSDIKIIKDLRPGINYYFCNNYSCNSKGALK